MITLALQSSHIGHKKDAPAMVEWSLECEAEVEWSQECEDEFTCIKEALYCILSLTIPTLDDSYILQTDASAHGIRPVLSFSKNVGEKQAFFTRKLPPRENKYAITELEGLAIFDPVDHFASYLISRPFTIMIDHKALTFLDSSKTLILLLARWALRLQTFTFSVYRPGHTHGNVDKLSHYAWPASLSTPVSSDSVWLTEEEGGGGGLSCPRIRHEELKNYYVCAFHNISIHYPL